MAAALLSTNPPFYSIGDQYPAFVLQFIFYGAMMGIARPWRIPARIRSLVRVTFTRAMSPPGRSRLTLPLVATIIAFLVVLSPFGPLGVGVDHVAGLPAIVDNYRATDS